MVSFVSTSWRKYLVLSIVFFWFRAKILKMVKLMKESLRNRAMLMKLPQAEGNFRPHFLGTITTMVPADKPLTNENVSKYFIKQLSKEVAKPQHDGKGLICLWALNSLIPIHSFGNVFVHDIDIARQILATKNQASFEKGMSYKVSRPLIGHGVLAVSHETHAAQRPLLDKGFKVNILKQNMGRIAQTAKEHVDKFATAGAVEVDVLEEMLKVTLDVLGRFAFSYDIGSVTAPTTEDAPLYHAFETIITQLEQRVRNPLKQVTRKLRLPDNIRFEKAMNKLDSVVDTMLENRLSSELSSSEGDKDRAIDLLDVLLAGLTKEEQKDGADSTMSKELMIDNIKTMLFAGHDTTASLLTWFLYTVAKEPEVGEKILKEARDYKLDIANPDLDILERLPYLNACCLEALRMYPSAAFTRTVLHDIRLGEYEVPTGTEVFVFPYLIHRDPNNYSDPDTFIPERWIESKTGSEQLTLQAQLARETRVKPLLPFSLGKRNCLGRPLALVEIRVVLLHLLDAFKLSIPENTPDFQDWPAMGLTLFPRGVKLIYTPKE